MANDIGRQFVTTVLRQADHGDRLPHQIVIVEHAFELTRFDAESAHLGLLIESAEKFDVAIRQIARQVAGPIDHIARITGHRVGDESLAGQVRPIQIAAGHAVSCCQELAGNPHGHGLHALIDDVNAGVGDGTSDEN